MIDRNRVNQWLADYVSAWKSYDRAAMEALFSEDATYAYNPYDEPLRGRDNIIKDWLTNPDEPNTWEAEYQAVAVEGNTAVSNGRTVYYEADGKTIRRRFDNIFVMKFDESGRCAEFTEWYMQPRGQ